MNKGGIIFLTIFLIGFISATCNSTQIDINTASAEELDKIIGIGPAYAEKIIQGRPFESVDNLINVSGIGEKTLEKIKAQELACVNEKDKDEEEPEEETQKNTTTEIKEEESEETKTSISISGEVTETTNNYYNSSNQETETLEEERETVPISLNSNAILGDSKDIKTENNKENLKRNLPFYGIITFCVIFGAWFFITRRKK